MSSRTSINCRDVVVTSSDDAVCAASSTKRRAGLVKGDDTNEDRSCGENEDFEVAAAVDMSHKCRVTTKIFVMNNSDIISFFEYPADQ